MKSSFDFLNKFFVYFSCLLIVFNALLPTAIVLAEEATTSAEISIIPTPEPTVIPTPEATPSATPTVTPTSTPTPTSAPVESDWKDNGDGSFQTVNDVVLDKEYIAVQNSKVKIKFNKLPNPSGKIAVREVKLTADQLSETKAISDTAYDISSTMENGTFEYILTLPASKTENVEVKSSEDGNSFVIVGGVTAQTDTLTITGLNHFTIFVIAGNISEPGSDTFVGESFDESSSSAVINEFVYNPASGNEWVELFNKTASDINLNSWTIGDGSHTRSLSGTLPAMGIFVYENTGADFLNNITSDGTGDTIYLKQNGTIIDEVTYQKQADGTVINNTSSVSSVSAGQSLYKTTDGGVTWVVASTPSKGWFNNAGAEGQAPLLSTIDTNLHSAGIESNIGELANPSSTPATEGVALYFEKTGQGKIVFEKALNLSDQATVAVLQNLGTAMEMSAGHVKFDSDTADAMNTTGAKIYMYGLNDLGYSSTPDIIIRDDDDNILGRNDPAAIDIESINYDSDNGTLSFNAKHFTQFDSQDPDIALVASDKEALTNDSIKGGNANLSNVTVALTNPLPSLGSNGSTIAWVSNNTSVVSNNGQTIVRPIFGAGNAIVTLTGTITKGAISDTKEFTLTVLESLNPAKAITAFSFSSGIGVINETNHTISVNVPFGTDVTALVATFTFTGAGVTVGGVSQVSSTTSNNFTASKTYRVTALDGTTEDYIVTVTVLASTQTAPNASGTATSNSTTPEVVITDPDQDVTVTVDGSTEATIDVSSFITDGSGDIPQITINSDNADVAIPDTTVTGPAGWDGVISAPTATTVTLPDTSGETKTLGTAIEIGFAADKLSFANAVRILLPNQAGKRAGYSRQGTAFTEITNTCAADNQATGDLLSADSECKKDVGVDLVIWTKHFTKFATYTQTTNSSDGSGSSNSGGDGLSDGLGCASHDCSIHPVIAWQTQISNPAVSATSFQSNVLGALIDNIILSSEPSAASDSASIIPSPTAGEVKGIASTNSDNWWLLFFTAGGLAVLYWLVKRRSSP